MRRVRSLWDEMRRIHEQMDYLFNNFFSVEPFVRNNLLLDNMSENKGLVTSNYKTPASDIYETDKEIIAEIDMPGVEKKDIEVNVSEDGIEVKAEKKHEASIEDKKKGMFRFERNYSGFYRCFSLPSNADPNKATAEFKNGVLKIKVPKLKIAQKKKKLLEIK